MIQFNPIQAPKLDTSYIKALDETLAYKKEERANYIKAATQFREAASKLKVEDEDKQFLNNKINEIENTIDTDLQGDWLDPNSIEKLAMKIGDEFNSPELNSMLDYKQKKDAWRTSILNSNLSAETKKWVLSDKVHPYDRRNIYAKDKDGNEIVDENGNKIIIGGTEFKPPVVEDEFDINVVLDYAKSILTPNVINLNGEYEQKADGNIYEKASGNIISISADRIKEAFDHIIRANPKYLNQLIQQHKVRLYASQNGDNTYDDTLYDEFNNPRSFNEWLKETYYPGAIDRSYKTVTQQLKTIKPKKGDATGTTQNDNGYEDVDWYKMYLSNLGNSTEDAVIMKTDLFDPSTIFNSKRNVARNVVSMAK